MYSRLITKNILSIWIPWRFHTLDYISKADPGPHPPPPVCVCKFWLYNTHILWFLSINNVYITYFIYYSCYKHIGYVWRGIKTNPRLKNSTAPGPPPPPVLKFLDPPLYMYMICFFGVFRPTREFFTRMETSPLPVKGCKFDRCSARTAIEQWGFFSVPHLLWPGTFVYYKVHLRGLVIYTYCRAFNSGAVTAYFNDLGLSQL